MTRSLISRMANDCATIPKARLEVINAARTFSTVDQPDRIAEFLSTIAART
jgi:hypothetical protein